MSNRISQVVFRCVCFAAIFPSLGGSNSSADAADTGKKYLIIHADDAGMSHSVNAGTIESLEKGIVSSASIMVPCPWFPEFAAYAKAHPQFDYGIHLTLNCEWQLYKWGPVAPREKVPSLVDPEGYLWKSVELVATNAKASEVEIELRAQIDRAKKFGVPLTHLDTHMGALVSRPDLLDVYVKLGLEYDLPVLFLRSLNRDGQSEYPVLANHGKSLLPKLDEKRLPVLDFLEQYYGGDSFEMRRETYLNCLRTLKPGVTELIIHCGIDNEELRSITGSSPRRDGDRRLFTSPEMREEIKKLGIEVITWKQFHEMARRK